MINNSSSNKCQHCEQHRHGVRICSSAPEPSCESLIAHSLFVLSPKGNLLRPHSTSQVQVWWAVRETRQHRVHVPTRARRNKNTHTEKKRVHRPTVSSHCAVSQCRSALIKRHYIFESSFIHRQRQRPCSSPSLPFLHFSNGDSCGIIIPLLLVK